MAQRIIVVAPHGQFIPRDRGGELALFQQEVAKIHKRGRKVRIHRQGGFKIGARFLAPVQADAAHAALVKNRSALRAGWRFIQKRGQRVFRFRGRTALQAANGA